MARGWDPASVEAGATVGAAALALAAPTTPTGRTPPGRDLHAQLKELSILTEEQRGTREQARRAQAEGVAVWWPTGTAYNDFGAIAIGNPSGAPVYDMEVIWPSITTPVRFVAFGEWMWCHRERRTQAPWHRTNVAGQATVRQAGGRQQTPTDSLDSVPRRGRRAVDARPRRCPRRRATLRLRYAPRPELRSSWIRQDGAVTHAGYDQTLVDDESSSSSSSDESESF